MKIEKKGLEMKINIDREIDNRRCPGVYFCTVATTAMKNGKENINVIFAGYHIVENIIQKLATNKIVCISSLTD